MGQSQKGSTQNVTLRHLTDRCGYMDVAGINRYIAMFKSLIVTLTLNWLSVTSSKTDSCIVVLIYSYSYAYRSKMALLRRDQRSYGDTRG